MSKPNQANTQTQTEVTHYSARDYHASQIMRVLIDADEWLDSHEISRLSGVPWLTTVITLTDLLTDVQVQARTFPDYVRRYSILKVPF